MVSYYFRTDKLKSYRYLYVTIALSFVLVLIGIFAYYKLYKRSNEPRISTHALAQGGAAAGVTVKTVASKDNLIMI